MKPWEQYAGIGTEQAGTDALDESTKPWEVAKKKALPESFSKTTEQLKAEHAANVPGASSFGDVLRTQGPMGVASEIFQGGVKGVGDLMNFIGTTDFIGAGAEAAKNFITNPDPLALFKAPAQAFEALAGGVGEQIGKATTGPQAFGEVVGPEIVAAGIAPTLGAARRGVQGLAGTSARKLVNSTVKPTLAQQSFKKDPTGAILRNKIQGNSLEDFAANVQAKIDEFHGLTDAQLAQSTKTVPVNEVTSILDKEVARIKDSVGISNKEALLGRIEELQVDILNRYAGQNIPLRELNALRKEIDSNITRFTMDAVEQGANASKYEARTGINRLIRNQEPKVENWMREESELLSAKEALDRRANAQRNAGFGVGDTATGIAGEVLSQGVGGVPGVGGAAAVIGKKALGSTAVKSRVANYLNTIAGERGATALPKPTVASAAKAFKLSDEERNAVQKLADSYIAAKGGKLPTHKMAEVREELSKKLADFYETSKHTPDDPKVQASYKALADETLEQWDAIRDAGYTIEKWTGEGEPYANSVAMTDDVRNNKHLYYKPSESSFGTGSEGAQQLMMGMTREGIPVNDVFRAVHDFFGHSKEGNQFGPKGEFNAWLIHSDMYSPEAQGALAAETLAQNSVVNFGKAMRNAEGNIIKKGEPGYLGPTERPFAEQKNLVVPDDLISEAKALRGGQKGSADSIIKNGGGTFSPDGQELKIKSGYQVSVAGHEKVVPLSELTPERADQLFAEYGELARKNGGSVGVWVEGDNAVWDVSKHFENRDEAVEFGRSNKQRAMYDWGKGDSEMIGSAAKLSDEPLSTGPYMIDNKGKIHKLDAARETHRDWIAKNYSKPDADQFTKRKDFDNALDAGYIRIRNEKDALMIEASKNNPNWVRDVRRAEAASSGDKPVYLDTFQNGSLKQHHFDDPQEFRDWLRTQSAGKFDDAGGKLTASELDTMEAGLSSLPKGQRGIQQRWIAEQRAKLKKEKPKVEVTDATREVVDLEAERQDMVEAWIDEFAERGAPKKERVITEDNRRYYEGRNFGDVPGLDRVGAGDEAIIRALRTRQGPVWEKINQAAEEQVQLDRMQLRRGRYDFDDAGGGLFRRKPMETTGEKIANERRGSFREEEFDLPGEIDRKYKGPERRKLPRAEGTIREEEFNFPSGVTEIEPSKLTTERTTGYSPKRGKIVLNDEAMDKLTKYLGANHLNGVEVFSGTAVSGSEAVGREFIADLKRQFPKEFAMVPTNKPLAIQRIGDSEYFKATARHEGTHRAVNEVVESNLKIDNTKYFTQEGEALYKFALNKKRHYQPEDRAEEILADLATGNPMRLGLTRVEGLQLLGDMLEQLSSQYGPEKMKVMMRRFAPRFYERAPEKLGNKLPRFKQKPSAEWDQFEKDMLAGMEEQKSAAQRGAKQWNPKLSDEAKPEPTWYGTAKERLEDIGKQHGLDLRTLAGVAAALSPNNRWAQNLVDVKKWAAAFKAGTLTEKSSAGTFGKNRAKAFRIMNGEDPEKVLQGPKVRAFFKALIGEGDEPVIDFHMANILRGSGYKTTKETEGISAAEYKKLAQQLLDEAAAAGMKPADYQAKRWIEHRDKGQKSLFPERGGE